MYKQYSIKPADTNMKVALGMWKFLIMEVVAASSKGEYFPLMLQWLHKDIPCLSFTRTYRCSDPKRCGSQIVPNSCLGFFGLYRN